MSLSNMNTHSAGKWGDRPFWKAVPIALGLLLAFSVIWHPAESAGPVSPRSEASLSIGVAASLSVETRQLVGNASLVSRLEPEEFVGGQFGLPTVRDILSELAKTGRDPRSEFKVVRFSEEVQELEDLREGMVLEAVVTNVTRFGAFVDVGVHQDGLIHISELDRTFVRDPSDVVSVGEDTLPTDATLMCDSH